MADKARTVLSVCNNMGEVWLLTPEIGSVEKVGVASDPKRVGPASRNLEHS